MSLLGHFESTRMALEGFMPTIDQVAKHVGVSVKTVSRALNGAENVSVKTRDKVFKAIKELNYSPSAMARHLKYLEPTGIGMLYGDPGSGYQARLNHSMLKACSDAQRYLAVELFDEKHKDWTAQVKRFLDRTQVKFLVLVPPMCDSLELHELLRRRKVKFVLISPSRPVSGADLITMDDRLAGYEATNYLINRGHRRIAHIAGHEKHVVTFLRRRGYEDAISDAGLALNTEDYIRNGRFRFKEAMVRAEEILALPKPPTAIFAANDHMAVAVMMAAQKRGLRIPDDLSIIGFDNTLIAGSVWPSLTTIEQPYDLIGQTAVSLLNPETDGSYKSTVLPHTLIERETVQDKKCP